MNLRPTFLNNNFVYMLYKDHDRELPWPNEFVSCISTLAHDPNPFKSIPRNKPILTRIGKSVSFDECMANAVHELESVDKPPVVYWSGGLDSSGIIAAIEKYGSRNLYKNLTIAANHNSVAENPELFRLLATRYKFMNSNKPIESISKDYTIIHGNGADQLYGTMRINSFVNLFGSERLKEPYKNLFSYQPKYSLYESIVSYCPKQILTIYDFFQWFAMSQEHELALNRLASIYWNDRTKIADIIYFYNTDDFFSWAIYNSEHIIPNLEWDRYKEHLRTYCENHFAIDLLTRTQYASGWYSMYLKDIICCEFNDGKSFTYMSDVGQTYADIILSQ